MLKTCAGHENDQYKCSKRSHYLKGPHSNYTQTLFIQHFFDYAQPVHYENLDSHLSLFIQHWFDYVQLLHRGHFDF